MPIQCIGGNWATSRTFCKKIGARNNVLTIINTYKRAEHCGGNNHHSKGLILELSLVPIQCISSMGGNWATSRTFCKKIGARNNVLIIKNTYKRAEHCGGNNHHSKGLILELSLVPIQCISSMGGNWATSRTFCKKISAGNNVLTIKNTYKRAEHCSGNNLKSKG